MASLRSMTAAVALSAALASPVFAQTATPTHPATAPASNMPATNSPAATNSPPASNSSAASNSPAAMNDASTMGNNAGNTANPANSTYMTADRDIRASKVIGASVYNDHNEKIGTIDELLMDRNHDVTQVVLSVGGFLGLNSKLVAVKINQLQVRPDRIVMAGATKDELTHMPTYSFSKS